MSALTPLLPPLPALSCDCHVHIVGAQSRYEMIADRQYTAPVATVDDLRAHMDRVGLKRAVIVQPSFYGIDNRCLVDSLKLLEGAGRGVAVLPHSVTDLQLSTLDSLGVRGIRINVESSHGRDSQNLQAELMFWSHKLASLGWHIQLFASQALIQQCAPTIRQLPVDVVLDHFSLLPCDAAANDAGLVCVSELLAGGNVWLKLSAAYRLPPAGCANGPAVALLAQRLITANIERIVWGSDWPHTQREKGKLPTEESAYRVIASTTLIDQLHEWLPTAALRQTVLVDNPANLYRFD
jgi:predicted TIM-barrel fold metal-dependent hydrolase